MDEQGLLVRGGFVYTADDTDAIHPSGSVLSVGGLIVAVGDTGAVAEVAAALPAPPHTIDADEMMVLPGFVNPHWHEVLGRGLAQLAGPAPFDDTRDAPSAFARGGDVRALSARFDAGYAFGRQLTGEEAAAIAEYSLMIQLKSGTTTFGDVGSMNDPDAVIAATRRLGLRGAVSIWASDGFCAPDDAGFHRTRDAAEVLDRWTALLAAQPGGDPRIRLMPSAIYTPNMSDELGAGLAALVDEHNLPFATHVAALRAESEVVEHHFGRTPVRRLADLGLLSDRLMAVHCAFVDDEEQRMLLAAGAHINHSPAKYGTTGESAVSGTDRIMAMLRHGADVSLSTDGEGLPIGGMAEAMRQGWLMHNERCSDNTAMVPTRALAMSTRLAARALRWQDDIGSIEAGKQADLVLVPIHDWRYVLRPRPLEGFLLLGGSTDVDTVVVGGRVLVERGRVVGVDEDELRRRFVAASSQVAQRLLGVDADAIDGFVQRFTR